MGKIYGVGRSCLVMLPSEATLERNLRDCLRCQVLVRKQSHGSSLKKNEQIMGAVKPPAGK